MNRLCSGPPPAPPVDAEPGLVRGPEDPARRVVALPVKRDARSARSRAVVAFGADDETSIGWLDALLASGHTVTAVTADGADDRTATLALVGPGAPLDALGRWRRHDRARVAVLVLEAGTRAGGDGVDELVDACGHVVVADSAAAGWVRARGARALVSPLLLPTDRVDALARAAARRMAPPDPTVGLWAPALASLRERAPTVRVDDAPRPDPGDLATWTVAVWEASTDPRDQGRPPRRLVEAALAGVPVVMSRASARAAGGVADPELVVDGSGARLRDDLLDAVLGLVEDDDWRAARSARAVDTGAALVGRDARAGAVRRLLGWIDAGASR